MTQNFIGMLRIKNEARWLERVLRSIHELCSVVFLMDDHSTDRSREIALADRKVVYLPSPFEGLDESRDKNWLLETIVKTLPPRELTSESPHWVLCIDGDEELEAAGVSKIRSNTAPTALAYSLRIVYLWDDERHYRTDGMYGRCRRPSLFRLVNPSLRFKTTPWGGNLHCSSIPKELLRRVAPHDAFLLHYGYLHREDRLRKYEWYNRVDPHNRNEDCYRHMVQGDLPEVPRGVKLRHAGPLVLRGLDALGT